MLKIKDDVDLKELEKFGFKFKYDEDSYVYYNFDKYKTIDISFDDYILRFAYCDYDDTADVVYDITQAGLVEKV